MKSVNSARRRKAHARNFGVEAAVVRRMPCTAMRAMANRTHSSDAQSWCSGEVAACHVVARGMGGAKGGRFDLVPLCALHHAEAGEGRTSDRADFEARYGLDLRVEADRIAIEHDRAIGIRGLADRWVAGVEAVTYDAKAVVELDAAIREPLTDHERGALLGWVRRAADEVVEQSESLDREAIAHAIGDAIGGELTTHYGHDMGFAWDLCEAAGWPS